MSSTVRPCTVWTDTTESYSSLSSSIALFNQFHIPLSYPFPSSTFIFMIFLLLLKLSLYFALISVSSTSSSSNLVCQIYPENFEQNGSWRYVTRGHRKLFIEKLHITQIQNKWNSQWGECRWLKLAIIYYYYLYFILWLFSVLISGPLSLIAKKLSQWVWSIYVGLRPNVVFKWRSPFQTLMKK